jgi:hypothetical protein
MRWQNFLSTYCHRWQLRYIVNINKGKAVDAAGYPARSGQADEPALSRAMIPTQQTDQQIGQQ